REKKRWGGRGGQILMCSPGALAFPPWGLAGARSPPRPRFPTPPQAWGPAVAVKDIDPAIRGAAEVLGVVRTRALVIGQVNLPEYVGKGTIVDLEVTGAQRVEVSRYSYAIALHLQASRVDFEGPQTPRTIRV